MSHDASTDLTRSCADTLSGWHAPSVEQERLRRRYLHHLGQHRQGWSRGCRGAHLTASSLVCSATEPQVLLTLHAKLGRWLQTGGHIEAGDSSLESAALREAQEESGLTELTLDPHPLVLSEHPLSCDGRPTMHLDVQFLVLSPQPLPPGVSAESLDVRWFAAGRLPDVDQSVRDLVDAAASRLRWS